MVCSMKTDFGLHSGYFPTVQGQSTLIPEPIRACKINLRLKRVRTLLAHPLHVWCKLDIIFALSFQKNKYLRRSYRYNLPKASCISGSMTSAYTSVVRMLEWPNCFCTSLKL